MNKKIIIIEDNKSIRKLLKTVLAKEDFEIEDFGNASDALEWMKQNSFDLILSDILLPDISGSELLDEIKKVCDLNKTPAVAITGFASISDKTKYLKEGFADYITKPVNTKDLVLRIKNIINS